MKVNLDIPQGACIYLFFHILWAKLFCYCALGEFLTKETQGPVSYCLPLLEMS